MLVGLTIENFLSYKNETVFSMLTSCEEDKKNIIYNKFNFNKNLALSKIALITGPNASGKSNLIKSFSFIKFLILDLPNQENNTDIKNAFYAFREDANKFPCKFEISFIENQNLYIYKFSINKEKNHYIVNNEELLKVNKDSKINKTKLVFKRSHKKEENKNIVPKYLTAAGEGRLYLSVAGFWKHPDVKEAYDWFKKIEIFRNKEGLEAYPISQYLEKNQDRNYFKKLTEHLKKIDAGINDLSIDVINVANLPDKIKEELTDKSGVLISLHTEHIINNKKYYLPFQDASEGTQRFLGMIAVIIDAIESNKILIIDEIENSLHPELLIKIIEYFNLIKSDAQFIFTTHNTNIMNLALLEKEQIFLTEKDDIEQSSNIYSLAQIKGIRMNEHIQKKYLKGRYGAFPYITLSEIVNGK